MPTHTTSCASMQAGRAAVLGLATVLAATGAATGTAGVLASTPTSFKFVASTKGPSFVFGGGVDAVLASNDGSGNIYACGKSGALGLWSLADASLTLKHGQPPGKRAETKGCSDLTFLHPTVQDGPRTLAVSADAGVLTYTVATGSEPPVLVSTVNTSAPVIASKLLRHFAPSGDPDAYLAIASADGTIVSAAKRAADGGLVQVGGTFESKAAGLTAVSGMQVFGYMGIDINIALVSPADGPTIGSTVKVGTSIEPDTPEKWSNPLPIRGLPGWPKDTGCGPLVEHNDVFYVACTALNTIAIYNLDVTPQFTTLKFPGQNLRGVELVGNVLFAAGGNDVYVYNITDSYKAPALIGNCGDACSTILGSNPAVMNGRGMSYFYTDSGSVGGDMLNTPTAPANPAHMLALTASVDNRLGVVQIVDPGIIDLLTRYTCDKQSKKCVPNQHGDFNDEYSCRLTGGVSGPECYPDV